MLNALNYVLYSDDSDIELNYGTESQLLKWYETK